MEGQPPIAEELACALIVVLLRRGLIERSDFQNMPGKLTDEAERVLDALLIEAHCEPMSESEFQAEQRRKRFRIVGEE